MLRRNNNLDLIITLCPVLVNRMSLNMSTTRKNHLKYTDFSYNICGFRIYVIFHNSSHYSRLNRLQIQPVRKAEIWESTTTYIIHTIPNNNRQMMKSCCIKVLFSLGLQESHVCVRVCGGVCLSVCAHVWSSRKGKSLILLQVSLLWHVVTYTSFWQKWLLSKYSCLIQNSVQFC